MDTISQDDRCTCTPTIAREGKTYPPMTVKADYLPGWATGIARWMGMLQTPGTECGTNARTGEDSEKGRRVDNGS